MLSQTRKSGFTLIELLVVISVIGLLASITLAALSTAQSKAHIAAAQQFASGLEQAYKLDAVGIWDLNDAAPGNTTNGNIADTSGNKRTGSMSGTFQWINGVEGSAVWINGGNINFGNLSPFNTTTFTMAMWIWPQSLPNNTVGYPGNKILGKDCWPTSGYRLGLDGNGTLYFDTSSDGGSIFLGSSKKVPVNSGWQYIAVTFNNNKAALYLNGQQVGSVAGTYNAPACTANLQLNDGYGGWNASNNYYDDFHFYSNSLTAMQINKLYAESRTEHLASDFLVSPMKSQ